MQRGGGASKYAGHIPSPLSSPERQLLAKHLFGHSTHTMTTTSHANTAEYCPQIDCDKSQMSSSTGNSTPLKKAKYCRAFKFIQRSGLSAKIKESKLTEPAICYQNKTLPDQEPCIFTKSVFVYFQYHFLRVIRQAAVPF